MGLIHLICIYLGMRKHALDRPFNKDEDIDFTAKKGARRSHKKRKVDAQA